MIALRFDARTVHPRVNWTGDTSTIESSWDHAADVMDADVVLSSGVLSWPQFVVQDDNCPGRVALYYPADGIGTRAGRAPSDLARVVGAVRAALLADLGIARSTTELAIRHNDSPGTISYHLSALRAAKLVARHRHGRFVLYECTPQGAELLDRAHGED